MTATRKATDRLSKMCQNLDAPVVVSPDKRDLDSLDEINPDQGEDIVLHVERYVRFLDAVRCAKDGNLLGVFLFFLSRQNFYIIHCQMWCIRDNDIDRINE